MKKYYLGHKEITKEEAKEVEKKNNEYTNSKDFADWAKIQFITVITK